jgi:hypothetical protein
MTTISHKLHPILPLDEEAEQTLPDKLGPSLHATYLQVPPDPIATTWDDPALHFAGDLQGVLGDIVCLVRAAMRGSHDS